MSLITRTICLLVLTLGWPHVAFTATNVATDPGGGGVVLIPSGPVEVLSISNAVTSAVAEIAPNTAFVSSATNTFTYDILPTINVGDTGLDRIAITVPAGYGSLSATAISAGGAAQSLNCPTPGAGQYCAVIAGQVMTVTLGTKITASLTNIKVTFTAKAPNGAGSAAFNSTIDDSSNAVPPQNTTAGNADGDAADANSMTVTVLYATVADPLKSSVTVDPPIVNANGVAVSAITVILRDVNNLPVFGKTVTLSSSRGAVDTLVQPGAVTDANGVATGSISSLTVGVVAIIAMDTTDGVVIAMQPQIAFTQGLVLELRKTANKKEAVVGDVISYLIEIRNKTTKDVTLVRVDDRIPPNFKYLKGSARLNGAVMTDPAGNRPLTFDIGTVPALVDSNGNGRADPGEPGYMTLSYQLVIGAGAMPREYVNTAVAKDICDRCFISNTDEAKVTVILDPLFDLGTIIGKVFDDKNRNGWQDRDEKGIAGAMVVLDNGTYAITDEYGRYHFPAVQPGQRLIKINLLSLSHGAFATTDEALVVSVTPGLLVKANFGVISSNDTETIGRPKQLGVFMKSEGKEEPVQIVGNAETLTVLINGQMASLPTCDVRMAVEGLSEVVEISGHNLDKPVKFSVEMGENREAQAWSLDIFDARGSVVRRLQGKGTLPSRLVWDGLTNEKQRVKGGEIYQYQLEIQYVDGSRATSARMLFGVNQTTAISLNMSGSAFETGSDVLSQEAATILKKVAEALQKFPQEKVIIEGHTDSIGSKKDNLELSKKRAEAAMAYLINVEKVPADRFTLRWYGSSRPIVSNFLPEGRALNRRVEVKGEVHEVDRAKLLNEYRTEPVVRIDGSSVKVDPSGRFSTLAPSAGEQVEIEVANYQGRSVQAQVSIPALEIMQPRGEHVLAYGEKGDYYLVAGPPHESRWKPDEIVMEYQLVGRTTPGNTVELDGKSLPLESDGTFKAMLKLKQSDNPYGILVRNPSGYTRIANLTVVVKDRDDKGHLTVAVKPIPNLTVKFPPRGQEFKDQLLTISGVTDKENTIKINDQAVSVQPDGYFARTLKLSKGNNRVVVQATDPEGYVGMIEREIEVGETQLFFLAFGDGVVGQLHGKGYLDGAGMKDTNEYYSEGRVAYYLKGTIAGKYLITSAFDTGTKDFKDMFKNLDRTENDRLLTNLDPDKLYPVYGDSSTIVYDAQSQGKFYLAVDSDEFRLLMGNYPLALTETELATYQRTLYGARAAYQSVARTRYGKPDTEVVLFGAEIFQAHVQDELRATGGSLYYLSHRDIIEGSEQVTLLVRDKTTGLTVTRIPQQQNVDYTIKYEEGRILFRIPIASVVDDVALIHQGIQPGNPAFIQVDYETRVDSFKKTSDGGRVRQQIGDHVAVGGTYVKDELLAGKYSLQGVDTEVRFGKNTRIIGEYAETSGTDSLAFVSSDGGLTFKETTPTGIQEGKAWKAAVELDIGELFGTPDRVQVGGYLKKLEDGFLTNGNFAEKGTQKSGANMMLQLTQQDKLLGRHDREELEATGEAGASQTDTSTIQYIHSQKWWEFTAEYQSLRSEITGTNPLGAASSGAARLKLMPTDKLSVSIAQQETLSGTENDQTTLGVKYQVLPQLALEGSGTKGTLGQSMQGGLVYKTGDKNIYLMERVADDRINQTTSTIIGSDYLFAPSSKIYSEYQWEHSDAENGARNITLVGAQKQWDVAKGLTFLLSGEKSDVHASGEDINRYTLATGLSYVNAGLRATTRNEVRDERGNNDCVQYLTVSKVEIKLDPDYTIIGKYRYSITHNRDKDQIEARFDERSIGLAYRPVNHDQFNALAQYTRLHDQSPLMPGATEPVIAMTEVTSAEWSLQFNRFLEWVEKGALKIKNEDAGTGPSFTTHTTLLINRLNVNVWRTIDLGAEYRILAQKEAKDQREGWLAELMWKPVKHFRFGIGYNFTDFSDNEFSNNNYSVRGWYIRLQGKY